MDMSERYAGRHSQKGTLRVVVLPGLETVLIDNKFGSRTGNGPKRSDFAIQLVSSVVYSNVRGFLSPSRID